MCVLLLTLLAAAAHGAGASQLPGAGPWSDTLYVSLNVRPGHASVEVRVPPAGLALPIVGMPPWGGVDLAQAVAGLEAETLGGEPLRLRVLDGGEWEVPAAGEAFTLRYRVSSAADSVPSLDWPAVYRPTMAREMAVMWGVGWLIRPLDAELAGVPVKLVLRSAYEDTRILEGGTSYPDAQSLARTLIVAGDFRRSQTRTSGQSVRLLARGEDWRFSDEELLQAADAIIGVQVDALGFLPPGTLNLVLLEGTGRGVGGTAEGSTIVLFPDPDHSLLERDPETLRLLAHEHLHRWVGERTYSTPERGEGRFKWFHEGVTEYLAFRTLIRARFLEPGDFVFKINQYIDAYWTNPAAFTATADAMEWNYWSEPTFQRLAYEKGMLLALAIDVRIHAATDGRGSVWDFVRQVVADEDPEYDDATLLEALAAVSRPADWTDFVNSYVLGAAPIDVAELCATAEMDCLLVEGEPPEIRATRRSRRALERLLR